jgi:hypothetical protein
MTHPLDGIDLAHQCRDWAETAYTKSLGDALEALFDEGKHSLDEIVAGLNAAKVKAPDGVQWTAESFKTEIARLGV